MEVKNCKGKEMINKYLAATKSNQKQPKIQKIRQIL